MYQGVTHPIRRRRASDRKPRVGVRGRRGSTHSSTRAAPVPLPGPCARNRRGWSS